MTKLTEDVCVKRKLEPRLKISVTINVSVFCVVLAYSPYSHLSEKGGKLRNRYNQAPHLTQDTNGKVTTAQLDITNESQEVNHFSAGDHKALINRRARKLNKNNTEIT